MSFSLHEISNVYDELLQIVQTFLEGFLNFQRVNYEILVDEDVTKSHYSADPLSELCRQYAVLTQVQAVSHAAPLGGNFFHCGLLR